ncbi:amino acid ABC transporter ATP-binding protein [Microbacterium sp.]|uniref:amino acid ABC transporter ATP-binding protein n=1 Tax=Microbacterium sp. TaxID=51671 RepID=UPI00322172D7
MTTKAHTAAVRLEQVTKSFGTLTVLRGVDLVAEPGTVTCIIGPSGCGKSTLLRCINHLTTVDSGRIWIGDELAGYREANGRLYDAKDRDINRMRSRIGMVFQHFNLYGHMTVLRNITEAPVKVLGQPARAAKLRALELLEQVGLSDKAHSYPRQLSGGQQQRVAIVRALAGAPELVLFDEPTSALDPELVQEVLEVMRRIADEGMTMIVVTHELAFAREVADQVVFMDAGKVVERGTPAEVLDNPREERTRRFIAQVRRETTEHVPIEEPLPPVLGEQIVPLP